MSIRLSELPRLQPLKKVVIHSLDISMYQASIEIDGEEHYIADNKGKLLRTFNLLELQKVFRPFKYEQMVLRQESPYDEMIGHPPKGGTNRLEVPLFDQKLD